MPVRPTVLILAAMALVASGAALHAAPARTSLAPHGTTRDKPHVGGRILYQRSGDERTEVAVIGVDGSGLTSPWSGLAGGDQTNPDPDPTSSRVTFVMSDGQTDDLWVADRDGGDASRLLDCASPCLWIDDPAWSPDGRRIVFSRTVADDETGVSTLETVDVETGQLEVVLGPSTRTFTAGARWSPRGDRVVFEQVHKVGDAVDADIDGVVLSVVGLDHPGHPVKRLTDGALFAATADWSRDGRRIVYSALATPSAAAPDLFTISPRGGPPARVTRLAARGGFAAEPTYAGCRIVFSGRVDGSAGEPLLLVVGVHGGRVRSATGEVETPGRHPRLLPPVSGGSRRWCR
jgi:Tol biopolymer transport system component